MNTLNEKILGELSGHYSYCLYNDDEESDIDNANSISIGFSIINGEYDKYIGKTIKLPKKKEIDIHWILSKLDSHSVYANFAHHFRSLINATYPNTYNVYATTYGIGVSLVFRSRQSRNEIDNIKRLLSDMGVEYRTELSDASWVYRFKLSKSKDNMLLIKNFQKQTNHQ